MVKFKFNLGDLVKDRVTGLEGVVLCASIYATGCQQYGVQPKHIEAGKPVDWEWIDEVRLELVEPAAVKFYVDIKGPGGPMPIPKQLPTAPQM